jgi:hypothetical protein
MKSSTAAGALTLALAAAALSQDPGWPHQLNKDGAILIYYQPQVDSWSNFNNLEWRMAFSLTPAAGQPAVGVAVLQGVTEVNHEDDMVLIRNIKLLSTNFPSLDSTSADRMNQLARTFLPPTVSISMRRLVASVPKSQSVPTVSVRNDPPPIFVSERPAILLFVDGQPQNAAVPGTNLEFVVNTEWPLFEDKSTGAYYLLVSRQWMTANALEGPWSPTGKLPGDMDRVPKEWQWASLRSAIPPPPASDSVVPTVFYSNVPAEVILFNGAPIYGKISGTRLTYVTNTPSDVFFYTPGQQYYYLAGGRWFRANSLKGPWSYATANLPPDFALIPPGSPAGRVLSSVPGTEEAKDAVLLARVPTTLVVNPATAAANVKVAYEGQPEFKPINGTSLFYAANSQDKVIRAGDVYYLCLQGIWFMSPSAQGPWTTATTVPSEIYSIPPSSPVYNVTYVTQTVMPDGNVQASYTAGYLGGFITGAAIGAVVISGTGYYYAPYLGYAGYPVYHPYPATYGVGAYSTSRGAYGAYQTAYSPYGSATRKAQYNPYTGTYARGASVSTPYGSRSGAQAYNPYTGAYAAHAQGSSPTAQWGSSVVSKNGESAYAQHYTTPQGTTGSVQTSSGGKAAGVSTASGTTAAGKTASGDMYAGHDGNVYRNSGDGWQKYDNGSWNTVTKPSYGGQPSAMSGQPGAMNDSGRTTTGQERPSGSQAWSRGDSAPQGLQKEFQDRQRGAQESQRFEQSRSGGFGGRSGGFHGRR